MNRIEIQTTEHKQIIDITAQIQGAVAEYADQGSGVVVATVLHTTAALSVADLDPGTDRDIMDALIEMVPGNDVMQYRHPHDPEHTPDHILSALIGPTVSIPYKGNGLVLGTWQNIVLCEFSGPRTRTIELRFLSCA